MPVTKKRPHIYELLNFAVDQRNKLEETRTEILERPASIWLTARSSNNLNGAKDGRRGALKVSTSSPSIRSTLYRYLIISSRLAEKFMGNKYTMLLRALIWPVALAVMIYESPQIDLKVNNSTDMMFYRLDLFVNSWFLLDSVLRMLGVYIRVKIEQAFHREVSPFDVFRQSGFLDIILVSLCFSFGITEAGLWLRLIRLVFITSSVFDMFPHIDVLMSGITYGIKSIFFTVMLLFFLIMTYGCLGHQLFAINDPFHFGSYAQSVLTFFQLVTFENWSTIFYVNFYGCDSFAGSEYGSPMIDNSTVHTIFGNFELPICSQPHPNKVASVIIFCSFALLAGYVLVSMNLAAVAIGINERLEGLRKMSLYGEDEEDSSKNRGGGGSRGTNNAQQGNAGTSKASKLLGSHREAAILKAMLKKVWEGKTGLLVKNESMSANSVRTGRWTVSRVQEVVVHLHKNYYYLFPLAAIIVGDAFLQVSVESSSRSSVTDSMHIFFHLLLCLDNIIGLLSYYESPGDILKDFWLKFDIFMSSILILPTYISSVPQFQYLGFLRFFRIARVFKIFSFVTDLGVIISAIGSSFMGLLFVLAIIVLFFCYFAIAGTLLFKNANPFYFSGFGNSLTTLLQVMTLDNWSDVMRKCSLGCNRYGFYDTGVRYYEHSCRSNGGTGDGVGWFAPIYFVAFIIMSAMVLSSLLVGVIITSMELLREGVNEEGEIWKKVRNIQNRYGIDGGTVDLLLELFERVDKNSNGHLTFEELRPLMDLVDMSPSAQFAFYMRVDTDKSGQIDFSEFCEMIILMGMTEDNSRFNLTIRQQDKHSFRHSIGTPDKNKRKTIIDGVVQKSDSTLKLSASTKICPEESSSSKKTESVVPLLSGDIESNAVVVIEDPRELENESESSEEDERGYAIQPMEESKMLSPKGSSMTPPKSSFRKDISTNIANLVAQSSGSTLNVCDFESVEDLEAGHYIDRTVSAPVIQNGFLSSRQQSDRGLLLAETTKQLTMKHFNISSSSNEEKAEKLSSQKGFQWFLDKNNDKDKEDSLSFKG